MSASLQTLVREAQDLATGRVLVLDAPEAEVARQLQICNACRYCEGFCAVFPAMTRRFEFPAADVHYLANLCHNCGACLHACQYAPPHEFMVNMPQAMARVRGRTYQQFAWPAPLGALYDRNGLALALALAAGLALFLVLGVLAHGGWDALLRPAGETGFYAIFPHGLMAGLFGPVFLFAVLALGIGVAKFWRDVSSPIDQASPPAARDAVRDALTLKYLDGGHGEGCHNESDRWTLARRRAHHLVFYGFLLCFAATVVGTVYHYGLGWIAPYDFASLPKLLGMPGGVMLATGCAWLAWLNLKRHPEHKLSEQRPMDLGFIALLFVIAVSGLALALVRSSAAMPLLLCAHLGAVMALFATLPYGKFAHGVYRSAALLKWHVERRLPSQVGLKDA